MKLENNNVTFVQTDLFQTCKFINIFYIQQQQEPGLSRREVQLIASYPAYNNSETN